MEPSAANDQIRPPVSKTAYVLDRMRDDIAKGTILPGQPLKQTDLAARYGVSPTPVREALRLLEADGSISYSPHRGATVLEMDKSRVRDLYLLRAAMESLATRLAVERLTEDGTHRAGAEAASGAESKPERARGRRTGADESGAAFRDLSERLSDDRRAHRLALAASACDGDAMGPARGPRCSCCPARQRHRRDRSDRDAGAASAYMYEHVMTAGRFREDRTDG